MCNFYDRKQHEIILGGLQGFIAVELNKHLAQTFFQMLITWSWIVIAGNITEKSLPPSLVTFPPKSQLQKSIEDTAEHPIQTMGFLLPLAHHSPLCHNCTYH